MSLVKFVFDQDFSTSKAGESKMFDKPFALELISRGLGHIETGEPEVKEANPVKSDKTDKVIRKRQTK